MDRSEIPLNPFTVHAQMVVDEFTKRAGLLPSDLILLMAKDKFLQFRLKVDAITFLITESDVDTVIADVNFDSLINPDQSRLAVVESRVDKTPRGEALKLKKYWRMHYCQVLDRTLKDFGFRIATSPDKRLVENNAQIYGTLQPSAIFFAVQLTDEDSSLVVVTE